MWELQLNILLLRGVCVWSYQNLTDIEQLQTITLCLKLKVSVGSWTFITTDFYKSTMIVSQKSSQVGAKLVSYTACRLSAHSLVSLWATLGSFQDSCFYATFINDLRPSQMSTLPAKFDYNVLCEHSKLYILILSVQPLEQGSPIWSQRSTVLQSFTPTLIKHIWTN